MSFRGGTAPDSIFWSTIRESGNHFCDKVILKPLNVREFLSSRYFRLVGGFVSRETCQQLRDCVPTWTDELDVFYAFD